MTGPRRASEAVVNRVLGCLATLATRGVTAFPSSRQLAIEVAQVCDLALRTVQRAFTDARAAELVDTLVCPTDTRRVSGGANPQVSGLAPHPDDEPPTSLLLGQLCSPSSPGAASGQDPSRYYTRLRPNDHPGYCTVPTCVRWVEADEGAILVPYPPNAQVRLFCASCSALVEASLVVEGVRA